MQFYATEDSAADAHSKRWIGVDEIQKVTVDRRSITSEFVRPAFV